MQISPINSAYSTTNTFNVKPDRLLYLANKAYAPAKDDEVIPIKNIIIKDNEGNDIEAELIKVLPKNGRKGLLIRLDGEVLGVLKYLRNYASKSLEVAHLRTTENKDREFKGIGTELLKQAVIESKNEGFEGRLTLFAMHTPPPVCFYYKNNFRMQEIRNKKRQPVIRYSCKNNINLSDVNEIYNRRGFNMKLSKKGANALLEGERFVDRDNFMTKILDKITDKIVSRKIKKNENK